MEQPNVLVSNSRRQYIYDRLKLMHFIVNKLNGKIKNYPIHYFQAELEYVIETYNKMVVIYEKNFIFEHDIKIIDEHHRNIKNIFWVITSSLYV